ncbi:Hypothetical Protein FCC1311_101282 [Hondaea fermentalgiana]|uniref:WW domain-containing protein n=1 Tax=Hondaea fermentalgiana TaxID=2315210 RepID=A0A2R5GTK0_9STRA|nr:Hypothetical Protein FCC1311_101282 [Hondaea fermentalgiana]|eukprot:GBG33905.1 Hypothetical Protein FCC1311_101282 [Hondaea fermentalgiana]
MTLLPAKTAKTACRNDAVNVDEFIPYSPVEQLLKSYFQMTNGLPPSENVVALIEMIVQQWKESENASAGLRHFVAIACDASLVLSERGPEQAPPQLASALLASLAELKSFVDDAEVAHIFTDSLARRLKPLLKLANKNEKDAIWTSCFASDPVQQPQSVKVEETHMDAEGFVVTPMLQQHTKKRRRIEHLTEHQKEQRNHSVTVAGYNNLDASQLRMGTFATQSSEEEEIINSEEQDMQQSGLGAPTNDESQGQGKSMAVNLNLRRIQSRLARSSGKLANPEKQKTAKYENDIGMQFQQLRAAWIEAQRELIEQARIIESSATALCAGIYRVEMPTRGLVYHGSTWSVNDVNQEVWTLFATSRCSHRGMQAAYDRESSKLSFEAIALASLQRIADVQRYRFRQLRAGSCAACPFCATEMRARACKRTNEDASRAGNTGRRGRYRCAVKIQTAYRLHVARERAALKIQSAWRRNQGAYAAYLVRIGRTAAAANQDLGQIDDSDRRYVDNNEDDDDDDGLECIWSRHWDSWNEVHFYFHKESFETTFQKPSAYAEAESEREARRCMLREEMHERKFMLYEREQEKQRRLENDWSVHVDPESGAKYYENVHLGISTWDRPEVLGPDPDEPLWKMYLHPALNRPFYVHRDTQEATWERPVEELGFEYTECWDFESNQPYWVSSVTGEWTYERPDELVPDAVQGKSLELSEDERQQALDNEANRQWFEAFDEESGRPYYYCWNAFTKTTEEIVWDKPDALKQFVDLISHPEPTLRKAAIINIGGLFRKFPMWDVLSPRDAQGFVTALLDTVVGDEIIDIRLHAAKVLGSTLTISNYAAAAAAVGMFRRVSKARLPGSSAISDDQSQRKRIRIFVVEFIARAFNASAFPPADETRYWCFRSGTRPTQQLVAVVTSLLGPVIQFEQPEARLRCRAGILFVAYELLASREQLSPLVVANLLKMLEAESDLLVSQNDEADNASDFDFVDAEDADAFFEGDFACSDTLDVDLGLLQFCALFVPLMQDLLHDYKEDRRVEKAILTFLGIWASVFSRMDALEVRFRAAELRKECVTGFGALLGPHASRYEGFAKALAAADQEYAKLKVEVRRRVEAVRSVLQRPGTVVQLFAQKSDEAATASSTASHEAHAPVFASRTHGLADRICGIESMAMPVPTSERALVRVALRIPELPEVPENCTTVPPMLFRPGTELIPVCTPSMLKAIPDLQDMAELGYSPFLGVIAQVEPVTSMQPFQHSSQNAAGGKPRYDGESAESDDSSEDSAALTSALGSSDSGEPESAPIWAEDDRVEIRFRTSNGDIFAATVMIAEALEDDQDLEMWGSDRDESGAEIARSNPVPAALCGDGKVLFAPPCNFPPIPIVYKKDSGLPLYGAALPLRKRPVACTSDGIFAFAGDDRVTQFERPLVYSNSETKGGTAQEGLGLVSDEKKDTKVADGPNNEDESEEGEEDEDEEDDDDDLILGTFVGGDTESFSQLSSESSERGTSSTSLMAALYSADPSDDPANGRKTVPLLFDRAVIEFTHTTTEETCKVKVQTKFAPKRDLDVFVMLDPPEVFEVVPAVLRFSPAVTSISLDIIFRPQRHTEKSSSVQGEIRVQEFSGQVLGTAELRGFCGPAFEIKSMLRRPLWIGPGQQTTFIVAVSNVTPKQLDVAIKIIANTDDVEDDTYETDENLAFAADEQAIYAADPTDKTKAPVTLTRKRRSTLRAMDLEAPPTLSTLVDALERSPSGTAGGGATTKASNTTGPGRRNMNAFVKKPWAQVRKLMGGLGGFRVQRRVPYDRPQDRPQENVPFLEELARTAVNYSVVGKSLQAADPKLTLRYRLQEHDDNSDGDSDDESSVDSGPEWVNFDAHAKLDVDFGLVDPFQVIKRKFIIENMSSESSLVSLTLRGCPWIKLPNLLEVPARNQAIVDLELSGPGDWTGAFDFVIEITSMILRAPLQVRLIGFVGRALEFPLAPRTFFGISAPSGKPVTLSLPVVNHSPYELHFLLLPLGTHFTAAISSDPSTKTKIPALGCAWIEVSFSPGSFRGIYRSVLGVRVLHPVSITYAAAGPCGLLELVGVVAAPSGPQIPGGFDLNRIAALEAWIQETSPSSFVGPAGGSLDFARASGSVSQHTNYKGTSSKVVVEASVIAEDDSKLSVFASRGLVAESLGPSRALIKPENSVSDYPLRFGLVGVKHHLTVDNFPSHVSGILVCQEGPISFNILPREGRTPVVNFGNCLAGASSRRWVTIRNWSSKPVRYVLDLGDMEDRFGYAPVQVAGQDQEGHLAPFAACFLPLTFKPESEGQLREMACVQAFSDETYGHVQGRDAKREHAQEWAEKHVWATEIALVGNALVEAIHGLPEADELFDFGAVPVDSMTTRIWEPRNKGTTVQKLTFNVASPFTVSPALVTLEPEESAQVTISFHATTVGSYLQELTCMANGKPMVFPLRGIVGELKASTSAGPSGLISYGTRKTDTISSAFVTITNKGSLPLELSRVLYIGSPDLAWQLRKFQILFAGILPSYTETGQKVHIIERKHAWAILRRRLAHALRITRNKSVEAGMSSLTSQKIRMSMSRKGVHSRSSFKNSTLVYKVSGRAGLDSGFPPSQASKLQSSKRLQPLQQPSLNHKLARLQGSKILPASSMRSHEGRPGQMSMKRASPQIVSQQGSSGYLLGQSSHLLHPDKAAALMNAHADAELERFCKNGNTLIPIVPEIPSLRVFRPSAAIAKSVGSDAVDPEDTLAGRAKASTLPELPPLKSGDSYLFRIDFEGKLCVPLSVPVKLHFGPWQVSDMRMDLGLGDAEITNVKDCSQVLRFEGNAVRRLDLKPDVLAFKPTPAREHFPPDVLPEGNLLHIVATNASPHTLTFNCARCNNLSFEIPDKMIVVQPGSSVTVPIRFRPIHANTDYHANLALEDMFGRRNIRLSGRGAAAKVEAVTDVVRFPAIKIGKSATAKFILRNAGLFKSQIHISCNSEYFTLGQESFILGASGGTEPTIVTCTLPASARHSLRDTFAVEASLEVRWQLVPGGNWTTWLIPVSAEIGTVILEADAVECDLGLVTLNCASQASFRLRNLGTAPCEWTALHDMINATSGDCLNVELSASSGEIGAGQDTVLTIQFEPRTCDLLELVIPIESDGGNLTLRICGTVVAPQLIVPEDLDMDFGVILLEKRMQKGFKVENVGRIAVDVRAQLFIHNHTLEGSRKAKASRIVSMWGSSQEGETPTKVVQSAIRGRITELRHEISADREEALPDPDQVDFVRGACFALGPVEAHLEPGESVTTVLEAFGDPSLPDVQSEAVNVIGSWVITAQQLVDVEWKGRLRARIGKLDANVEVPTLLEGSRPREISAQDGALYSYFGVCMVNCEFLRRAACELVNNGTVNIEFLIQPEPRDMSNGDDSQEPVFEIQPRAGQLAPGERISIDVVFLAQTEGFHRLVTDVRFRPTGSAASSGGERLEQVVFCATSGVPRLVCLVGELKYGRCQIDGKPIVQTFQLQSAGNCPVSWSAKVVKGAEHFSLECFEGIISPQDDVLVPVRFSPRGACMPEDEDLLACTGLLLVEWAGQTPYEIELCGEGARGRLKWSVEGETPEGGIQFGTQPIHAGCHPAWRSVHLQNEGQLGLDVVVRADLDGSVFAICAREDERRQRDMEMQIERRFAQAELQQTLSGGALQVSRLMTQQALKLNSAARSLGDQNSKIFENEPVADRDMEDLSRLSSTDSKSTFTRKFHLTPGDVTVLHVGFAPIVERTHHGELEIGIAGVSGCEQHILVEGSGGEFRISAEQAMQIDSVGVGFTTLDTLTLRNTGKLHSQVEVTVDPPEVGQQMTFTVEEVLVHADDAHTRTRPMHETEMMHQKAHEAGIHHLQFLLHGESTVRLLVGFFPTHVGQLSGALLIRPLHEGLGDAEDLLATSSRVRAKETAGTRRQNIVGPFGLVIPFSIDAVNNRLRLFRTSNVAMGRLACGQTCTDIRLLANGTDMEIDFSVRFSRQDAAWSVSPEIGTLGPGTQVELHITFTTPREGESSGGKRDNAIDVDDWHEVEIEVLNETTGARDVCIRGYGAAGFPALQTNLDGQNRVDFGACQLNSAVSVPIVFRNVGTGMLHVQPRIEYESKEDHEQVLFIGWERPNSTHRDRSLPAQLDMAVGRSPEHLTYAKSLGDLLSHTGDGTGEGIDQPIFTGFGVLEPGAELRMMITFSPRFRGEVAAKLVIETNAERGRGGGASEVSLTGAGHSFDLHMDLLTNRIHFGTWMLGQSHTIKVPLRRRGDENVPVKLLFDKVRYERAWPPPFGCGGILTVGEGTTGKAKPEPLQHELGHVRLSSAEVDVSGSESTEENVDEVELELSVPSSWLDNKLVPKRESIEALRTLINAQPAPPANSTVSLFLLRPGSLPPYQIDVMFSFKFPRIAVELSEPVPSDGEKDRILIRDLGEIGRPGESVLAGLSEKDRSHVGAVIRFGSVLTRQAVAKSFVISSDSPLRIPFKAQIEVQKHANSTENYNAFFSLSRKEGVLEAEEPMAIKLRCNFSIPFDATHNPALVRIQFLHGALPEMIIPIDVRTMDHVFSAVHLAPVKFVEPVFVGRAGKGILRLANVTGDPVEANITFGDAAFSLGGGLVNPVKIPAQEEPMEIAVHFLPSEDAAYDSSIDIQVDKMVFSVGISGIGSRAGLKLKPTNCVDFGFVGAMLRGDETLAVRNTSALPLLVEVDCAGIGEAWLDARPRHFTLKARSSQMVQLEFLPTKEASYDGALVVRAFEAESDIKEKDSSMKMGSGAFRRRQLVEETVRVAGVGGRVSLAFPKELNFGRISTHIRQAAYLELANKGDVAMDVRLVARDVDGVAVVKFVPSELALLPGQSVDVNVLLTLQLDQEQSFWIDILPVVADAQDFGVTASNPYSWSLRVAAFGDKIDLSEEMQRILAEERLPKLAFRSDDVEDEHLRHVLRPVVQLPQASFAHLLRPVEPSLDAASVQFQNALARPAPLVSEVPQHATRPKWHENRAPLKLERSSRESAAQALSTSYTFSNARWKALFAGGGDDDDDGDLDHDNSGSRGGSGPHDENGGIHANHARRK